MFSDSECSHTKQMLDFSKRLYLYLYLFPEGISRRDSSRSEVVLVPSKFGDGATCMRALCEEVGTTRRTLFFVQFLFNRREGQPWTHRGKHVYIQAGWRHSILIRVYTLSCVYTLRFLSIFNIS